MKKILALIAIISITFVATLAERYESPEIKKKLNRSERRAKMRK
jgi:hypothetical protein